MRRILREKPLILAALLTSLALGPEHAGAQAAGAGMAGAYGLKARGAETPSWNPALLAWDDTLHIQFLSIQGSFNNNSFSLADYNRWNGETWDDAAKREILGRIPGDMAEARAGVHAVFPGVAYRNWSLTVESRGVGRGEMSKELARLILLGNEPEESFHLDGSDGAGMAYTVAQVSHGRRLNRIGGWDLAAGATVKFIRGWAYAEVTRATGDVTTTQEYLRGNGVFEELTSLGGSGFGLDIALAARSEKGWRAGLSLRNITGSVRWSRDVKTYRQTIEADSINLDELEDDPDLIVTDTETVESQSFSRTLSPVVDIAVAGAYQRYYIEANLAKGLRSGPEATTTPRFALGVAYPFGPWFEGRAGFALGGLDGPVLAVGSGFKAGKVLIDAALQSTGGANPFSGKGLGFGLSVGLR